jgi:hypothetical protein|tara:strand:+ start:850 stop:1149 length:300 start_codon:yes stop_codon:yes gene_type:complete
MKIPTTTPTCLSTDERRRMNALREITEAFKDALRHTAAEVPYSLEELMTGTFAKALRDAEEEIEIDDYNAGFNTWKRDQPTAPALGLDSTRDCRRGTRT